MALTDLLRSGAAALPTASAPSSLPLALLAAALAAVLAVSFGKAIYTWARCNYYLAKVREREREKSEERAGQNGARQMLAKILRSDDHPHAPSFLHP